MAGEKSGRVRQDLLDPGRRSPRENTFPCQPMRQMWRRHPAGTLWHWHLANVPSPELPALGARPGLRAGGSGYRSLAGYHCHGHAIIGHCCIFFTPPNGMSACGIAHPANALCRKRQAPRLRPIQSQRLWLQIIGRMPMPRQATVGRGDNFPHGASTGRASRDSVLTRSGRQRAGLSCKSTALRHIVHDRIVQSVRTSGFQPENGGCESPCGCQFCRIALLPATRGIGIMPMACNQSFQLCARVEVQSHRL